MNQISGGLIENSNKASIPLNIFNNIFHHSLAILIILLYEFNRNVTKYI